MAALADDIRVEARRGVLFETPVVSATFHGADALIAELRTAIEHRMATDPDGVQRSNIGGWHSDTKMLEWGGAGARLLWDKSLAMAKKMSAFAGASHEDFDWGAQMWANVSRAGASNHMHVHPGNLWSAVFYVDLGGAEDDPDLGGAFYFEDPRFPIAAMHNTRFRFAGPDGNAQSFQPEVRPKAGELLMFPAWLRHGVRPYHGPGTRMSIALNIDAIPR